MLSVFSSLALTTNEERSGGTVDNFHYVNAICTQPKWPNQVGSLDFGWSVYSSSTSFLLD